MTGMCSEIRRGVAQGGFTGDGEFPVDLTDWVGDKERERDGRNSREEGY